MTNQFITLASTFTDPEMAAHFERMGQTMERMLGRLDRFRGTSQERDAQSLASCIAQADDCDTDTACARKAKRVLERNVALYASRLGIDPLALRA